MIGRLDPNDVLDLLRAIAPFPPNTIVIGGCALPIFRFALRQSLDVVHTRDLDLAANLDREIDGFDEWTARLARLPGYRKEMRGRLDSPGTASSILEPEDPKSPRIELLARPLVPFKGHTRSKAPLPKWTAGIQPQRIDGISLLFEAPWRVDLDDEITIPVANPLAIVLQKASLKRGRRSIDPSVDKARSDIASIFDIARMFVNHADRLDGLWIEISGSRKNAARKGLRRCRDELFDARSTAVRAAEEDFRARGHSTSPRDLVASLRSFFDACGVPER